VPETTFEYYDRTLKITGRKVVPDQKYDPRVRPWYIGAKETGKTFWTEPYIFFENGKLSLSGLRRIETTGSAQWEEFGDIEYRRVFSVPQTIDTNRVEAILKDGVLGILIWVCGTLMLRFLINNDSALAIINS